MSYDGFVTHAVMCELNEKLSGGRIDKIHQPERDEITISVRTQEGVYKLLLCASASNPRVHLTSASRENPKVPPMLCMLMRKHIQGGKIIKITQQGFDRILRIDVEGYNELADVCVRSIIVEIMGRHSNIILVDENGKIMDSAKHIDFTVSAVRQVLPGLIYELPPSQDKAEPKDFNSLEFMKLMEQGGEEVLLDKLLLSYVSGLSPLIAREMVYRCFKTTKIAASNADSAAFVTVVSDFLSKSLNNEFEPCIVIDKKSRNPIAFSCIALTQYENGADIAQKESISEVVDEFYLTRAVRERMSQRNGALVKLISNNIDRCEKKIIMHRENIEKSKNREIYKIRGDLLTANMHAVQPGLKSVKVINYYSADMSEVEIPLKEDLSPSANAQRYYKLYNKAKGTEKYAAKQIKTAEEELVYLESVLESLNKAETPSELAEIRDEIAEQGYIPKSGRGGKKRTIRSAPLKYISSDGYEILVGRNNKQNDELTLRTAFSTDIWLHTKNIPGSHTIIRTGGIASVPESTLVEAARLAALHSKACDSSKVSVDYTNVKNVKKPSGAKPGMVIYVNQKTLMVDPHESQLNPVRN